MTNCYYSNGKAPEKFSFKKRYPLSNTFFPFFFGYQLAIFCSFLIKF